MPKRSYTITHKKVSNPITGDDIDVRCNWMRRLRNALIALSQLDPGWLYWVECQVPRRGRLDRTTRLVEARARALLLGRLFPSRWRSGMIFADIPFGDDGDLLPG